MKLTTLNKMKAYHIWVLGVLLLGVLALAFFGFFNGLANKEGFYAQKPIRCPPGYKFFNGSSGDSMCCRGTINPYTHMCEGVEGPRDKKRLCSLSASVPDPRSRFKGTLLPDCRTIISESAKDGASSFCPESLPNFAEEDENNQKCCKNAVQLVGETGYTCSSEDLTDTSRYCIVKGVPAINPKDGKMEKLCKEAQMLDTTTCPTDDAGNAVFQKIYYVLGDREAKKYDIEDLKGIAIPTCYRVDETCIPKPVIEYVQSRGAFTEYDPSTWEYSCSVWSKKNRGETVPGEVNGYLKNTKTTIL